VSIEYAKLVLIPRFDPSVKHRAGSVDSVGVAERCKGGARKHVAGGEGRFELAMFA